MTLFAIALFAASGLTWAVTSSVLAVIGVILLLLLLGAFGRTRWV